MSTFTDAQKVGQPPLDGPNDLRPEVKTSLIIDKEAKAKAKKKTTKKPLSNYVSTIKTTRIN